MSDLLVPATPPVEPPTRLHSGEVDASPPPLSATESTRSLTGQILLVLSFFLIWGLTYFTFLSGFEQGHAQDRLYGQLRSQLAEGTAPVGAPIAPGAPVALLSAPGAGINRMVVVEGTRPVELQDGPGHVLGSVLPGQQGVSMLAGRSLSFGGPFAHIDRLRPGSGINVTTAQGSFSYQVVGIRRTGDPLPSRLQPGAARLTLVTAARGSAGLGALQAGETVFVDAELSKGAAVGGARSLRDPGAELMAVKADVTTLALLALSLQLLVIACLAFAWAWSRWSRRAAWIALAPCVLASLWLVSSIGSRLLPALV